MRIPLASDGVRELAIFGSAALAATAAAAWLWPYAAVVPAAVLVFVVAFFRDPEHHIPAEDGLLVAPADGHVTEVTEVDEPRALGGRAGRSASSCRSRAFTSTGRRAGAGSSRWSTGPAGS